MNVPATEAVKIVDSADNLVGFTLQNNDAANDVWVSSDRDTLNQEMTATGGAPTDIGIRLAANGGSWTVMFYTGVLYARAIAATVNLRKEMWRAILP